MVLTSPSASVWDAWEREERPRPALGPVTDVELERFITHVPDRHGRSAVDVGCGTGGFTRQLHRFGFDVTGLDFSSAALAAARLTPLTEVRYLHHDLNAGDPPGLPSRAMDLVVCRHVLPFLNHRAAWMSRVRDHWLRPGGQMYLVVPVVDEHATQPGGVTEAEIAALPTGWADVIRYDLRGPAACLILRSPAT